MAALARVSPVAAGAGVAGGGGRRKCGSFAPLKMTTRRVGALTLRRGAEVVQCRRGIAPNEWLKCGSPEALPLVGPG